MNKYIYIYTYIYLCVCTHLLKNVEVYVKILKNVFKCIFNFMCIYFLRLHMHVSICVYTCLFQYFYIRVCLYLNYVCIRVCLCKIVLRLLWFCCEGVFLTEQICTTWLYSCVAAWVTWRCALWCLSRTMQPWIKIVVGRCWCLETHQNLLQVIGESFMVFHLHIRILFIICIYIYMYIGKWWTCTYGLIQKMIQMRMACSHY